MERQKGSFSEMGDSQIANSTRGLGVGNLEAKNLALLGNWLWIFSREMNFLPFVQLKVGMGDLIRFTWQGSKEEHKGDPSCKRSQISLKAVMREICSGGNGFLIKCNGLQN